MRIDITILIKVIICRLRYQAGSIEAGINNMRIVYRNIINTPSR